MKQVPIDVYVLLINNGDGDTYTYVYQTRKECIDHLYEMVKANWTETFGDDDDCDDIDDYEREEAIDHYYNYGDNGYYEVNKETVSYSMMELQDRINKAIGASHG